MKSFRIAVTLTAFSEMSQSGRNDPQVPVLLGRKLLVQENTLMRQFGMEAETLKIQPNERRSQTSQCWKQAGVGGGDRAGTPGRCAPQCSRTRLVKTGVMANCMCAMGCLDRWSNIIPDVSVRVFLDKLTCKSVDSE